MIKELFKDTFKYLPSQIVPPMVGLFSIPIVTRLLLPADYGNYILVISAVSMLSAIMGWISMSVTRFYSAYEQNENLETFYTTVMKSLFISLFVISVLFLAILLISKNYIPNDLFNLMIMGLLVFISSSLFGACLDFFRVKRLASWYTNFSVWKSVASVGIGLILIIFLKFGVDGLLWGIILSIILVLPFMWKKAVGSTLLKEKISKHLVSEMVKYSIPLMMGNLAYWVLALSDRYILEFFRGANEVGIYSASYGIGEKTILFFVLFFSFAAGPIGMIVWERDGVEKSKEFTSKLMRYFLIICVPATLGLSVLSKQIIKVFTSAEYYRGWYILPWIAVSIFLYGLFYRFGDGLAFHKKTKYIMWSLVIGGVFNILLNFIFVPKYGYFAAAVSTFAGYIVVLVFVIYFSRKFFVFKFPFKTLIKSLVASTIMGAVVYLLITNLHFLEWINLIVAIIVGMIIYSIFIILFKEVLPEEEKEFKKIFGRYVLGKK